MFPVKIILSITVWLFSVVSLYTILRAIEVALNRILRRIWNLAIIMYLDTIISLSIV